jgi:flagellar L-ring protein precursor FlgH
MILRAAISAACLLVAASAGADSLFSERVAARGTFISDNKVRFEPGDIITVLVRENIDSQVDSELRTRKDSTLEAEAGEDDNATFTGSDALIDLPVGVLPNWDIEVENEHRGRGNTSRTNRLIMTITCRVTQVHANGNVQIEGQKRVTVNRDDSLLLVTGMARTRDVTVQNTVDSNLLADAVFELKGHGPLWNNERRGLFTRLLDWVSPF